MKNTRVTTTLALLLAFPAFCNAQEANPFDKSKGTHATVTETESPHSQTLPFSYVKLTECILVQGDVLNTWLETNPPLADATRLRAAVQGWIAEGKATPDHTSLAQGHGRYAYRSKSVRELMYPTDFVTADGLPDAAWPFPTAFETLKLGYEIDDEGADGDTQGIRSRDRFEFNRLSKPFQPFNQVVAQTGQRGDIFNPGFNKLQTGALCVSGTGLLVLRTEESPGKATEDGKQSPRQVRLVFTRMEPLPPTPVLTVPSNVVKRESFHLSAKLVRVDHRLFSDWIQQTGVKTAPFSVWEATANWLKTGSAAVSEELSGTSLGLTEDTRLGSVEEVRYVAEWSPSKSRPLKDAEAFAEMNFSIPGALETRQTGLTLEASLLESDFKGSALFLTYDFNRVRHSGKMVYSRIHQRGQWVPDVTMPVFSTNKWQGTIALKKGAWTLVGSGSDFDDKGELDPKHAVLAFIRAD